MSDFLGGEVKNMIVWRSNKGPSQSLTVSVIFFYAS